MDKTLVSSQWLKKGSNMKAGCYFLLKATTSPLLPFLMQ